MTSNMTDSISPSSNEQSSFFLSPEQNDARVEINAEIYKIMLTNARSLSPKIHSLHDMFNELDLDIALITESWLNDGSTLDGDVIDLEYGTGLKIIYKNRPKSRAGARRVGGGVSIVYNKSRCSLRERKVVGNKFELVVAVGKIGKISRQVAIFCVYIVPNMRVAELQELNELINSQILQLRTKGDPLIFVGGDLNHRSLEDALDVFPDITRLNYAPTRGQACLDVMHSNAAGLNSSTWPPLQTPDGTRSDHSCVVFVGAEKLERNFVWVKKQTRKHTEQAVAQFGVQIANIDWKALLPPDLSPDELVSRFENKMSELINALFPLRNVRYRSNEPPWISDSIRRLSRLKKRLYKRSGKSETWCRLRDRIEAMIETSKENFVAREAEAGTNNRSYFAAVKALSTCASVQPWDIMQLFPGMTPTEAGNEAAQYFTQISDQFDPLRPPTTKPMMSRQPISEEEVAKLLAQAKKPNSSVPGDVLPRLMKVHHQAFTIPTTIIFNAVFRESEWPSAWKTETTVIIPKTSNPSSLSECRNISCTAFLSKVLETVLLGDLRRELREDPTQYGGLKGTSVDHLLVDLYDEALSSMDQGRPAIILGIDYEKAFNRLDHKECLRQLRDLGASETSLSLVRSFLTNRSMRVKIGTMFSDPRVLSGGSPQGSILGCMLYCAATQQLNLSLPRPPPRPPEPDAPPIPEHVDRGDQVHREEDGFQVMRWAGNFEEVALDPLQGDEDNRGEEGRDVPWAEEDAGGLCFMFKYVDDTTIIESVPRGKEIRHISSNAPSEFVPATAVEQAVGAIAIRSEEIGMRVNCQKTQVVCLPIDNGYDSRTTVMIGQEAVNSSTSMKLLGFMISANGMQEQVAMMKEKFRKKFWSLLHLRRAGLTGGRLFRMYASMVRPVLETNSVVFHPMITKTQALELERLQKMVVRLCFGHHRHYGEVLQEMELMSLEDRRTRAVERFTMKALKNERFAGRWFRRRPGIDTDLRNRRPYIEKRCRTERMKRNPLVNIQRTANDLMTARN